METNIVQVAFEHPAEKLFDLEPGSTVMNQVVTTPSEPIVAPVQYDTKDQEVDDQYQQVFNAAFGAYEAQRLSTEGMNPQFASRALEIAGQFLNTALAAAKEKGNLKAHKDKLSKLSSSVTNNTTNNNVVMDRDQMLAMLMQQHKESELIYDPDDK